MRMKCSDKWFVFKFPQINTPVKRRSSVWQVIATVILLGSVGCGKAEPPQARPPEVEVVQVEAQLDVNRYIPLVKEQAVTQQDLDNAVQANLAAQAQVRAAKAQIDAAKAQVAAAQLNLGFTKIVSLIDGIAGVAQAQIGDL